jgi:hypothetical protein
MMVSGDLERANREKVLVDNGYIDSHQQPWRFSETSDLSHIHFQASTHTTVISPLPPDWSSQAYFKSMQAKVTWWNLTIRLLG